MSKYLLAPLMISAIAGCEPTYIATELDAEADRCGASAMQQLVGQPYADHQFEQFENKRVLRPNQPATADFNPTRINIAVNKSGKIKRIYCT